MGSPMAPQWFTTFVPGAVTISFCPEILVLEVRVETVWCGGGDRDSETSQEVGRFGCA